MLKDRYVQEATALFKSVTLALVGIGAVEPSKLLAASGNVFSPHELKSLSARGAVGDICLRFFDAAGVPVQTPLNERVISMELGQLKQVKRVVGIAGGKRKTAAIRGALAGGWINTLITDRMTAERLIQGQAFNAKAKQASPRHDERNAHAAGSRPRWWSRSVAGVLAILRPGRSCRFSQRRQGRSIPTATWRRSGNRACFRRRKALRSSFGRSWRVRDEPT